MFASRCHRRYMLWNMNVWLSIIKLTNHNHGCCLFVMTIITTIHTMYDLHNYTDIFLNALWYDLPEFIIRPWEYLPIYITRFGQKRQ